MQRCNTLYRLPRVVVCLQRARIRQLDEGEIEVIATQKGANHETGIVDLKSLPRPIREIEHGWIPLSDGTRLAYRCWLPVDADSDPVPALLEYIPYCKRDGTSVRDGAMHPYLAAHGYASFRVDLRGSGESDGLLLGEYLEQELSDAEEVIAWLSAQPWCTGRVGMFGKSWGGFNCLQVAARRPPALQAIITVCSTDDRYATDIHTMGGCQLLENPNWCFTMFGHNARPPDPVLFGEGWRKTWFQRMENSPPWILEWLKHQRRDAFWKHGSVCEDFSAITCPVFAVGGWADPYTDPALRLMEGLDVPRRAWIGPWGHQYPHQALPAPASGFLQESLRWWDRWLKDMDTGIDREPMVLAWMHDSYPPSTVLREVPGHWFTERTWPVPDTKPRSWNLNHAGLRETVEGEGTIQFSSPATVGRSNPFWGHNGMLAPESPADQKVDDALSLCFDSEPLSEPVAFFGIPVAHLRLASDRPIAQIGLRLSEVRADGTVTLVSFGLRNLTHDESHETVTPLSPGEAFTASITMNGNAYRFARGSRIRLALSTGMWPLAWPVPEPVVLTLFTGSSRLELPVRPDRQEDGTVPALPPPRRAPIDPRTPLVAPEPVVARFAEEFRNGRLAFVHVENGGVTRVDRSGWHSGNVIRRRFEIEPDNPLSASLQLSGEDRYGREGLDIRIRTRLEMTSDERDFRVHAHLDVYENGRCVFSRAWLEDIARDGV